MVKTGSREWNNDMFLAHPTPYKGIAGWIEKHRIQVILNMIKQHAPVKDPKIVELGCESGYLLKAIQDEFPTSDLTGVDISDIALSQAKERLKPGTPDFFQADICEPIPLENTFDVIICSETLEHIPTYEKALTQIGNLSNQHTVIILTVPLEALKNQVKNLLNKLGLMSLFFNGIEEGFSSWHVQDFSEEAFKSGVGKELDIIQYKNIWGLHQLILAKKKTS